MKFNYDKDADAAYLQFSENQISKDIPINDYCIANLDANDNLVGLEFLFASQRIKDFDIWFDLLDTANLLRSPGKWSKTGLKARSCRPINWGQIIA